MPKVKQVNIKERVFVKVWFNKFFIREEETKQAKEQTLQNIRFDPNEKWRLIQEEDGRVEIQQIGTTCRRFLPESSWRELFRLPKQH